MRISYETITTSLGPGERYVIWVQGCKKRCKGCINPEGWEESGGYEKSLEELQKAILNCKKKGKNITGVTISGGEPFLQFEELYSLIKWIKQETQLDVMLYSGYCMEELVEQYGEKAKQLFHMVDLFIDGEYLEASNHGTMYRGSDNQKIYFFTNKYRMYAKDILESKQRDVSFHISDSGDVYFIGIPPKGFYQKFMEKIIGGT